MCRWMGSHFHDWIDSNRVAVSIVTDFCAKNVSYLRLANVPEVESKVFFIELKKWVHSFYDDLFKGLIR